MDGLTHVCCEEHNRSSMRPPLPLCRPVSVVVCGMFHFWVGFGWLISGSLGNTHGSVGSYGLCSVVVWVQRMECLRSGCSVPREHQHTSKAVPNLTSLRYVELEFLKSVLWRLNMRNVDEIDLTSEGSSSRK